MAVIDNVKEGTEAIKQALEDYLYSKQKEDDDFNKLFVKKQMKIIAQQAAIERLKNEKETIKTEVIKEFVEKLKEEKQHSTMDKRICTTEMIDNIAKEMIGGKE